MVHISLYRRKRSFRRIHYLVVHPDKLRVNTHVDDLEHVATPEAALSFCQTIIPSFALTIVVPAVLGAMALGLGLSRCLGLRATGSGEGGSADDGAQGKSDELLPDALNRKGEGEIAAAQQKLKELTRDAGDAVGAGTLALGALERRKCFRPVPLLVETEPAFPALRASRAYSEAELRALTEGKELGPLENLPGGDTVRSFVTMVAQMPVVYDQQMDRITNPNRK